LAAFALLIMLMIGGAVFRGL